MVLNIVLNVSDEILSPGLKFWSKLSSDAIEKEEKKLKNKRTLI
jgi:hypothetical protein